MQVVDDVFGGRCDPKIASVTLYGLQLAGQNLHMLGDVMKSAPSSGATDLFKSLGLTPPGEIDDAEAAETEGITETEGMSGKEKIAEKDAPPIPPQPDHSLTEAESAEHDAAG